MTDPTTRQPQYIITEAVFNHVVAALRDNRQYDVAEYLINGVTHTSPPASQPQPQHWKTIDEFTPIVDLLIENQYTRGGVTVIESYKVASLIGNIRKSRPHTSPPAPNENQQVSKQLREASSLYRQGRKDGAKAARQPRREYIISEFALNEVVAHLKAAKMYDTAELMLVETRPHTSPPAQGTSKLCFGTQHPASECCQQCNELETCKQKQRYLEFDMQQAAKATREQVLDELKQWFIKNKCNGCAYGGNLLDKLQSLRAPQQQGVSEG